MKVDKIFIEELNGITHSIEKACRKAGKKVVRIVGIESCDGAKLAEEKSDFRDRFNVEIELDENFLSPNEVAAITGKISGCLLRNQTW